MVAEINTPFGPPDTAGVKEDPAKVAAMVAKAEGKAPPAEDPQAAPAEAPAEKPKLAGKFGSVEDLEKAYAALEKKLGSRSPASEPPGASQPPAPKADTATEATAKETVEAAGFDYQALVTEFETEGGLKESTYEALAKQGIGREVVDAYIAGQQAVVTLARMSVFQAVGGEENYRAMGEWAKDNLPKSEIDAFNAIASGSDFEALKLAARGLFARYMEANGKEPSLLELDSVRPGQATYQSWAEVKRDMRDPRYKNDRAFQAEVERKLRYFEG
jgi:hypothetical protein